MTRHAAAFSLKALAWLSAPLVFGLLIATVAGWRGLAGNGRMLAGWALLLLLAALLPLFFALAGRAVVGHETDRWDRRALGTGAAALAVVGAAAVTTPWRDLARWLAATLTELTGFSVPLPVDSP